MRKLGVGDVISVIANIEENYVDIVLNFGEFVQRFGISSILLNTHASQAKFVMGVSLANDHQLTLLGEDYSFLKKLHNNLEPTMPRCENCDDVMLGCSGLPETYPRDSIVTCDICNRSNIQEDHVKMFHCHTCQYDMCFACGVKSASETRANVASSPADGKDLAAGTAAAPRVAFGTLVGTDEAGPARSALEQLLDLARSEIRRHGIRKKAGGDMTPKPTPSSVISAVDESDGGDEGSFSWFAKSFGASPHRGESAAAVAEEVDETETSTVNLAISLMFAVAILRQSLSGILEVAYLLADEHLDLHISCKAEAFVRYIYGESKAGTMQQQQQRVVESDAELFHVTGHNRLQTALDVSITVATSYRVSQLERDTFLSAAHAASPDSVYPAQYTAGQQQAMALLNSVGNVVEGAAAMFDTELLYPILNDTDFSLLMKVVENGAEAVASADTSVAACVRTAFATQALRILYLNIECTCSSPSGGTLSASYRDANGSRVSYQNQIQRVLNMVVRNPLVDPSWSNLGIYAVKFASLGHLTPVASQQFAVVCELLNRVESGEATLCEREVLLSQMNNLKGSKLLELMRSSASPKPMDSSSGVETGSIEGAQFLSSLLSLANRSLHARVVKSAGRSAKGLGTKDGVDVQDVLQEVVLTVLEPVAIQVTSMLISEVFTLIKELSSASSADGIAGVKDSERALLKLQSLCATKLVPLVVSFLQSAKSAVDMLHVVADLGSATENATTGESIDTFRPLQTTTESVNKMHESMESSHVSHLVPLVLFSLGMFWDDLHRNGHSSCSKLLLPLRDHIAELSASLKRAVPFHSPVSTPGVEDGDGVSKTRDGSEGCRALSAFENDPPESLTKWNVGPSNVYLTYSDEDSVCERSGDVSCYPAAFSTVSSPFTMFTVKLVRAHSSNNWLTIGVCGLNMGDSNGDGFGREQGSWGICDDRSSDSLATFYADGRAIAQAPRKLLEGDYVTVICDLEASVCIIAVNNFEFSVLFYPSSMAEEILSLEPRRQMTLAAVAGPSRSSTPERYRYGATFANDHRLQVCAPYALRGDSTWSNLAFTEKSNIIGFTDSMIGAGRQMLSQKSWLYRLQAEAQYLQLLTVKEWMGHFQSAPKDETGAEQQQKKFTEKQAAEDLVKRTCLMWLESPLLRQGMVPLDPSDTEADDDDMRHISREMELLKQLTDAPNGAGDSQLLVKAMKKLVLKDRGGEAGENHITHSACAAMLWHCGFSKMAYDIVQSSLQGVEPKLPNAPRIRSGSYGSWNDSTLSPEERKTGEMLMLWQNGQDMRRTFREDTPSLAEALPPMPPIDPTLPSPPMSPQRGLGNDMEDPELYTAIMVQKQYSLPVPEDGSGPLNDATLAGVRRARMLLRFHAASNICRRGDNTLKTTKNEGLKAKSLFNFILYGPSPEAMKRVISEINEEAERRSEGLSEALTLFVSNSDISEKASLLRVVAGVLAERGSRSASRSAAVAEAVESSSSSSDSSESPVPPHEASPESDFAEDDSGGVGQVHYLNGLHGCDDVLREKLCKSWYALVQQVLVEGSSWLLELETIFLEHERLRIDPFRESGENDGAKGGDGYHSDHNISGTRAASLVAGILSVLALVTLDYDMHVDVRYLAGLPSSFGDFVLLVLQCRDPSVRAAGQVLFERTLSLCCSSIVCYDRTDGDGGWDARHKHVAALSLLKQIKKVTAEVVGLMASSNYICAGDVFCHFPTPRGQERECPYFPGTLVRPFSTQSATLADNPAGFKLLNGSLLADPYSEGQYLHLPDMSRCPLRQQQQNEGPKEVEEERGVGFTLGFWVLRRNRDGGMLLHRGDDRSEAHFGYLGVTVNSEGVVDVSIDDQQNLFTTRGAVSQLSTSLDEHSTTLPLNKWAFVTVSVSFPGLYPSRVRSYGWGKKPRGKLPGPTQNPKACTVGLSVNGHGTNIECHFRSTRSGWGSDTSADARNRFSYLREVPAADFINAWPLVLLCRGANSELRCHNNDHSASQPPSGGSDVLCVGPRMSGESKAHKAATAAIGEVSLFPWALSSEEVRSVYLQTGMSLQRNITRPVTRSLQEGDTWTRSVDNNENEYVGAISAFEENKSGYVFRNGTAERKSAFISVPLREWNHGTVPSTSITRADIVSRQPAEELFRLQCPSSSQWGGAVHVTLAHSTPQYPNLVKHTRVSTGPRGLKAGETLVVRMRACRDGRYSDLHNELAEDEIAIFDVEIVGERDSKPFCDSLPALRLSQRALNDSRKAIKGRLAGNRSGLDLLQRTVAQGLDPHVLPLPSRLEERDMKRCKVHFCFDVPAGAALLLLRDSAMDSMSIRGEDDTTAGNQDESGSDSASAAGRQKRSATPPPSEVPSAGVSDPAESTGATEPGVGSAAKESKAAAALIFGQSISHWDVSLTLAVQPSCTSLHSPCHRNTVIRFLGCIVRVGKALASLDANTSAECKPKTVDSPFEQQEQQNDIAVVKGHFADLFVSGRLLVHLFDLSFGANSSMLRLVAIRVLCLQITAVDPRYVDSLLTRAGYLRIPGSISSGSAAFLPGLIRALGTLTNPYSSSFTPYRDPESDKCVVLAFPVTNRSLLLFQLREIMHAILETGMSTWGRELRSALALVVPEAYESLSVSKKGSELPQDPSWLLGLLAASAPDSLVGAYLYPGAQVSHKGLGSTLSESFTVLGFEMDDLLEDQRAGELLYVCQSLNFDADVLAEQGPGLEAPGAVQQMRKYGLETVFSNLLKSELVSLQTPESNRNLFRALRDTQPVFLQLLQDTLCLDVVDHRPLPGYPTSSPYSETKKGLAALGQSNSNSRQDSSNHGSSFSRDTENFHTELEFESLHNYLDNTDLFQEISIPGASELWIRFDSQSRTEHNYDFIQFFKDKQRTGYWGSEKYSGTTWPGVGDAEPLKIQADTFYLHFHSDGSNTDWGWRFTVSGVVHRNIPRPLRPANPSLALVRMVKSSALALATRLLVGRVGVSDEDDPEGHDEDCDAAVAFGDDLSALMDTTKKTQVPAKKESWTSELVTALGPVVWRSLLQSLVSHRLSASLWESDATAAPRKQQNPIGGALFSPNYSNQQDEEDVLGVCLSTAPSHDHAQTGELLRSLLNHRAIHAAAAAVAPTSTSAFAAVEGGSGGKGGEVVLDTLVSVCDNQLFAPPSAAEAKAGTSSAAASAYAGTILGMAMRQTEKLPDNTTDSSKNVFSYLVGATSGNRPAPGSRGGGRYGTNNQAPVQHQSAGHLPLDVCDLTPVLEALHTRASSTPAATTVVGPSGKRGGRGSSQVAAATSENSSRSITSSGGGGSKPRPFPRYRVKCSNTTTHCRIRAGPSLDSAQVGDMASGSESDMCGVVNGFFRLADGRGFMKQFVECAITWERVPEVGLQCLQRGFLADSNDGDVRGRLDHSTRLGRGDKGTASRVDYWDSGLCEALGASADANTYRLLCIMFELWPREVPLRLHSQAELYFLMKVTGLGLVESAAQSHQVPKRSVHTPPSASHYGSGHMLVSPLARAFRRLLRSQVKHALPRALQVQSQPGGAALLSQKKNPAMALACDLLDVVDKSLHLAQFRQQSFQQQQEQSTISGTNGTVVEQPAAVTSAFGSGGKIGSSSGTRGTKKKRTGTSSSSSNSTQWRFGGFGGISGIAGGPDLSQNSSPSSSSSATSTVTPAGCVIIESKHEYANNTRETFHLHLPQAEHGLEIVFDARSSTEFSHDCVNIYADSCKTKSLGGKYSGRRTSADRNWPGVNGHPPLVLEGHKEAYVTFTTDGSNTDWGWRLYCYPLEYADDSSLLGNRESDVVCSYSVVTTSSVETEAVSGAFPVPVTAAGDSSDGLSSLKPAGGGDRLTTFSAQPEFAFEFQNTRVHPKAVMLCPSVGFAVAALELVIETAAHCADLAWWLFSSHRGAAILRHLQKLSCSVSKEHPAVFQSFLGTVSGTMLLYERLATARSEKRLLLTNGGSKDDLTIACRGAWQTMAALAHPLFHSRQTLELLKTPSSSTQALLQTLVCSYHAANSAPRGGGTVSSASSTPRDRGGDSSVPLWPPLTVKAPNLFLGKHLRMTRKGSGVRHIVNAGRADAKAAGPSIGFGHMYPEICLPRLSSGVTGAGLSGKESLFTFLKGSGDKKGDDSSKDNGTNGYDKEGSSKDEGSRNNTGGDDSAYFYQHTLFLRVVSAPAGSLPLAVGAVLLPTDASVLDALEDALAEQVHGCDDLSGSLAWLHRDRCDDFSVVNATLNVEEALLSDDDGCGVSPPRTPRCTARKGLGRKQQAYCEGDVVGVTLLARYGNNQPEGSESNDAPAAPAFSSPDSATDSNELAWEVQFSCNGVLVGSACVSRQYMSLLDASMGAFIPAVAVELGPGCEVDFIEGSVLPYCVRLPSTVVPPLVQEGGLPSGPGTIEYAGLIITAWDPSISDSELVFSQANASCTRPGNASCYPASLTKVTSDSASMTVKLKECPIGPNSMSFGIAYEGFRRSGSDGFGPSTNSWGLIESRSSGTGKVYSNRSVVGTFRKMQPNDCFVLRYERSLGKCWLYASSEGTLGEPELLREFVVHGEGEACELVMGATYCNDHQLVIEEVPPPPLPFLDGLPNTRRSGFKEGRAARQTSPASFTASPPVTPEGASSDVTVASKKTGKERLLQRRSTKKASSAGGLGGFSSSAFDVGASKRHNMPDHMLARYVAAMSGDSTAVTAEGKVRMAQRWAAWEKARVLTAQRVLEGAWCEHPKQRVQRYHASIYPKTNNLISNRAGYTVSWLHGATSCSSSGSDDDDGVSGAAGESTVSLPSELQPLSTVYAAMRTLRSNHLDAPTAPPLKAGEDASRAPASPSALSLAADDMRSFQDVPASLVYGLLVPLCMLKASRVLHVKAGVDSANVPRASVSVPGALAYAISVMPQDSNSENSSAAEGEGLRLVVGAENAYANKASTDREELGPQRLSEVQHTYCFRLPSFFPESGSSGRGQHRHTAMLFKPCLGPRDPPSSGPTNDGKDNNDNGGVSIVGGNSPVSSPPRRALVLGIEQDTFSFPGLQPPAGSRGDPSPILNMGLHSMHISPPVNQRLTFEVPEEPVGVEDEEETEEDEDAATARIFAGIRTGMTPPRPQATAAGTQTTNSSTSPTPPSLSLTPQLPSPRAQPGAAAITAAAAPLTPIALDSFAVIASPGAAVHAAEGSSSTNSTPARNHHQEEDGSPDYSASSAPAADKVELGGSALGIATPADTGPVSVIGLLQEFERVKAPLARFGPAVLDGGYLCASSTTGVDAVQLSAAKREEEFNKRFGSDDGDIQGSARARAIRALSQKSTKGVTTDDAVAAAQMTYRFTAGDVVRLQTPPANANKGTPSAPGSPGPDTGTGTGASTNNEVGEFAAGWQGSQDQQRQQQREQQTSIIGLLRASMTSNVAASATESSAANVGATAGTEATRPLFLIEDAQRRPSSSMAASIDGALSPPLRSRVDAMRSASFWPPNNAPTGASSGATVGTPVGAAREGFSPETPSTTGNSPVHVWTDQGNGPGPEEDGDFNTPSRSGSPSKGTPGQETSSRIHTLSCALGDVLGVSYYQHDVDLASKPGAAASLQAQFAAMGGLSNPDAVTCDGQLVTVRWRSRTNASAAGLGPQLDDAAVSAADEDGEYEEEGDRAKKLGSMRVTVLFVPDDSAIAAQQPASLALFEQGPYATYIPLKSTAVSKSDLVNVAGVPMKYGASPRYQNTLYCGRELGRRDIPGSDGFCGPTNGPQCRDCARTAEWLQERAKRPRRFDYDRWQVQPRTLWTPVQCAGVSASLERSAAGSNKTAASVMLSVVPVLGLEAVLSDPEFADLRSLVKRMACAMTAREDAVMAQQGGVASERQLYQITQRVRGIDESIVKIMEAHDARIAKEDAARSSNAPRTGSAIIRGGLVWADISPSSMEECVQYPLLHAALLEEHKAFELLVASARSGMRLADDDEDKDIVSGQDEEKKNGPVTFMETGTEGGVLNKDSDVGADDEIIAATVATPASSPRGDVSPQKGISSPHHHLPSPPRTPLRSTLQAIDPRRSHLLAARFALLSTLNGELSRCIAQIDLSQLACVHLGPDDGGDEEDDEEEGGVEEDKASTNTGNSSSSDSLAEDGQNQQQPSDGSSSGGSGGRKRAKRSRGHEVLRSLGGLLRVSRNLVLSSVTQPIVEQSIASSETPGTKFDLVLSRSRAAKYIAKGEVDVSGRWSCFGQTFRAVHGLSPAAIRRSTPIWDTIFAGERAQDAGGPYREAWSAITQELMHVGPDNKSYVLPLLRLCPNGVNAVGTSCETMVLNPEATSPTQLEMFAFLGKLFGVAIRSKGYLDISLSPLAWKLIAREELVEEDLRDVDELTMRWLDTLRGRQLIDEEIMDVTFTTTDLNGNVVELHPNGANEYFVRGRDEDRYARELVAFKLQEMRPMADAIRIGLETQIPPSALSLLRWSDLEKMVCGMPTIDVKLLRSCTEYSGCSQGEAHVQWFWEVMENSFTQQDLKAFVRFTWGRSRLPLTRAGFSQMLKIQRTNRQPPDSYLPVAHTCFFSIELPAYSSKEVLQRRLLYAIHNCQEVDGDETGIGMRAGDMTWE
jgi:hypothetical protein